MLERSRVIKNISQLQGRSIGKVALKLEKEKQSANKENERAISRIMDMGIPRESAEKIVSPNFGGGQKSFKSEY